MSEKTVEDYLNEVSYSDPTYEPSIASVNFINFIKLVNGEGGEENKSPVTHYKLADNIFSSKRRLAILCHRGFAKSTMMEYLFFYCAVFNKLDGFGDVNYALFIGDSAENGCRNLRQNMENRYNTSEFLQQYLPTKSVKWTDTIIKFTNKQNKSFAIKMAGAQQGVRGTRYLNKRPELCIMDDVLTDLDAKSPTSIANVENTLHKAVNKALHPTRNKIIYVGTIFSAIDPLYKVIESGVWSPSVFPVCEEFPCSEEDFRGSWEDRFPYHAVKDMYDEALALGRISDFNSEMMNRVMSEEDRLIQGSDIVWFKRDTVLENKGNFNFYITTDFATSEKTSADYSVISVWAYNNKGDWLLVDGICKKQLMDKNIDDLFRLAQMYSPQEVGVEVTGQQGGFIQWIKEQMMVRNCYFTLASDGNNSKEGIRPNTNKMVRFNTVVPLFKTKKILFAKEMRDDPLMIEAMDELRLVSKSNFKSKHDDVCDTISMLSVMNPWKPSIDTALTKNKESGIWELDMDDDNEKTFNSYIV